MNCFHILAVALTLSSTLALCFASVITPTQVHLYHRAPEKLNSVARQSRCDSKADCNSEESCINFGGVCEATGCDGFCVQLIRCSCSDPCDGGATCILLGESDGIFLTTCILNVWIEALGNFAPPTVPCDEPTNDSEATNDSNEQNSSDEEADKGEATMDAEEEEGDAVCIGVDLLQDFASHELVFEKHAYARVLCDTSSSCATKGHMVIYRGNVMMMRTYCSIVGCEQKIMKVNSPKYQRGLKVASRSEDMHLTAFAARYGTRVEEGVLAGIVHAGL